MLVFRYEYELKFAGQFKIVWSEYILILFIFIIKISHRKTYFDLRYIRSFVLRAYHLRKSQPFGEKPSEQAVRSFAGFE